MAEPKAVIELRRALAEPLAQVMLQLDPEARELILALLYDAARIAGPAAPVIQGLVSQAAVMVGAERATAAMALASITLSVAHALLAVMPLTLLSYIVLSSTSA